MPSISASTGGTLNYGRSIDPGTNTYTTTSTFNNSYSLSGSLTVFNGLSTINTIRAIKVMRAMGVEELQLARDQIAMNTMSAYFDVVYYYGTVEIAQEQLTTSQLELKQVQEQFELDLKAPADVAEVEAQVANYDYLLTEQQNNLALALIELRKVMNYPQADSLEIETNIGFEGILVTETLEEVLSYALEYNPQVRSKQMNSRYYELNYASTKGRYLPSISLSGGFSTNYFINLDAASNYAKYTTQLSNNRGHYIGMSMSIPIFSGLSRKRMIVPAVISKKQMNRQSTKRRAFAQRPFPIRSTMGAAGSRPKSRRCAAVGLETRLRAQRPDTAVSRTPQPRGVSII